MPAGALEGLKVVEMGQLIAGPFAAKTLADFGARVPVSPITCTGTLFAALSCMFQICTTVREKMAR